MVRPYSGQKKYSEMSAEEKAECKRHGARPEEGKPSPAELEAIDRAAAFQRATQRKGQPATYGTGKPPQS